MPVISGLTKSRPSWKAEPIAGFALPTRSGYRVSAFLIEKLRIFGSAMFSSQATPLISTALRAGRG